jgi:hypothetical protein
MKKYLFFIVIAFFAIVITTFYIHNKISTPGYYFKIGKSNGSDVFLRATPEYEYQITMEADSVIISYLGETIGKLPYESELGHILLQDNE